MSIDNIYIGYTKEELQDPEIRLACAKNPVTPPYVLKDLSKDSDWQVRFAVASNPGTPEGCLWELSYDLDTQVCKAALTTLDSYNLRLPGHKIPLIAQIKSAETRQGESSSSEKEAEFGR